MIKKENGVETETAKKGESAPVIMAAMIRQSSEAGQLITESEIIRRAADQHLFTPNEEEWAEEIGNILEKLVDENEDLHELAGQDGSRRYYSSHFMTETYAKILLGKQVNPLRLIAEIVRQNSEFYPRPVPLDTFTQPPFDLSPEEVLNDLEQMRGVGEYGDIVPTATSTARVFLYSTLHLEPDHASMLAEWIDVGQHSNP
jgi:hypothetical protein